MNFTQRKRIPGKSIKTYREWYSDCGNYRVSWRREFNGVVMLPRYFASVRCVRNLNDSWEYWGWAWDRRPYRTQKAAEKACEKNKNIWDKILCVEGRTIVTQLRGLREQATLGTKEIAYCVVNEIPVWVREQGRYKTLEMLWNGRQQRTEASDTSSEPTTSPELKDTPASSVEGSADTSPPAQTSTKGGSCAKRAVGPAKAHGKSASKRTGRTSKTSRGSRSASRS